MHRRPDILVNRALKPNSRIAAKEPQDPIRRVKRTGPEQHFIRGVGWISQLLADGGEVARQHPLIGVYIQDPFAANKLQPSIPRFSEVGIPRELEHAGSKVLSHLARIVDRAGVDQHHFVDQVFNRSQTTAQLLRFVSND